jgi:hypothetical protein
LCKDSFYPLRFTSPPTLEGAQAPFLLYPEFNFRQNLTYVKPTLDTSCNAVVLTIPLLKRNKMSLKEFNTLDANRRSHLIWVCGHYIANIKTGNFNKILFALEDFFVEVDLRLDTLRKDEIVAFGADELKPENYGLSRAATPLPSRYFSRIPEYLR